MNRRQLLRIGIPDHCHRYAMEAVQAFVGGGHGKSKQIKTLMSAVVDNPDSYVDDEVFQGLAKALVEDRDFRPPDPIDYQTWGDDIDEGAHGQMKVACHMPNAVAAAMMPDAHVGYGLPIGGVLALDNAIAPYAVGVDIACRMKLSVLDLPVDVFKKRREQLGQALESQTRFGVGARHERNQQHDVMDADWTVSRITREKKDLAWTQLGTSGSGNHFVEFGQLTCESDCPDLNLEAGSYVALLSHSGSRGAGASVCSVYSSIARSQLDHRFEELAYLSWLSMDSQEGQEYFAAMNLMGEYAAANHDVIHRLVSSHVGAQIIAGVENHHNFAWIEEHNGKSVVVHRKGATPAGEGVLGVIPGSMADPAYVVRGKGNAASLNSASHGAGRRMSRKKGKETYRWNAVRSDLEKRGVTVLSAGADEVPGVYKNIDQVMAQQSDLVDTLARFDPLIVKMCGDGSRAED